MIQLIATLVLHYFFNCVRELNLHGLTINKLFIRELVIFKEIGIGVNRLFVTKLYLLTTGDVTINLFLIVISMEMQFVLGL